MGNLGFQEVLLIVVVILVVFGPDRLPEMARQAGKFVARLRAETSKSVAELKRAADIEDLDRELRSLRQELRGIGKSVAKAAMNEPSAVSKPRSDDAPPPTDPEAT